MHVYSVREYDEIDIPSELLISTGGELNIYPKVLEKRLLEITYKKNKITFKAGSNIGEISVNKDVIVKVSPKIPLANLMHMLVVSNHEIGYLDYYQRNYSRVEIVSDNTFDFLVKSFISEVKHLLSEGIYKIYDKKREVTSFPKGKIDFNESIKHCFSKGKTHEVAVSYFRHDANNPYNKLIKYALRYSLEFMQRSVTDYSKQIKELYELYQYFSSVELDHHRSFLNQLTYPIDGNELPTIRKYYVNPCNLGHIIIGSASADFDSSSGILKLSSFLINMAYIFESYILAVFQSKLFRNEKLTVLDGNREGMKNLFFDSEKYKAKPDYIFYEEGKCKLVADAKYKIKPDEHDRYQIISHAISYGATVAVLILPKKSKKQKAFEKVGQIGGGATVISVYLYHFDLDNQNLSEEEDLLTQLIIDEVAKI
jgi:5-methylcytosine-specific restriction enzyme subunit McrC